MDNAAQSARPSEHLEHVEHGTRNWCKLHRETNIIILVTAGALTPKGASSMELDVLERQTRHMLELPPRLLNVYSTHTSFRVHVSSCARTAYATMTMSALLG